MVIRAVALVMVIGAVIRDTAIVGLAAIALVVVVTDIACMICVADYVIAAIVGGSCFWCAFNGVPTYVYLVFIYAYLFFLLQNTINMKKSKIYSEFAESHHMPELVSLEEIEERIEQEARQEEADNIILAEDKRMPD